VVLKIAFLFVDAKEGNASKRRCGARHPRKAKNLWGKKLFDGHDSSEEEDSISASEQEEGEEEEDEELPLIHSLRSSSTKLRSLRVPQQENKESKTQVGTTGSAEASHGDAHAS
jgi:cohesin complex subunit SA-1/2